MSLRDYIEITISWVFKNFRGRDSKLFVSSSAFDSCPSPTIHIISLDCGETDTRLSQEYTADGEGRFPEFSWEAPADLKDNVKEWLLISEDPDAPLPTPIAHGIFGGIHSSKTTVTHSDFVVVDESKALLAGDFHYGVTRRGVPYIPPRPLMNHGPHRYFFFIIALSKNLDKKLLEAKATREQVTHGIHGSVLGWGRWVGTYERLWI